MKVRDYDNHRENKILAASIMVDSIAARIASKWEKDSYKSPWANIVAGWVVKHQRKYGEAPKRGIQSYFERWAEKTGDEDTAKLVEKFLVHLSDSWDDEDSVSPDLILDDAGLYFREVKLERTAQSIQDALQAGEVEKAEKCIASYSRIDLGGSVGSFLLTDKESVMATYAQEQRGELLPAYTGVLETFFQNTLEKDAFVSFAGAQKSGKSWWLLDVAWRSILNRKRVAFFGIGDLTEWQFKDRFQVRVSAKPSFSDNGKWPTTVRYPIKLIRNKGDHTSTVEFKEKTFNEPLDGPTSWEACERFMKEKIKSKEPYFHEACFPARGISILGIRSEVEMLIGRGFIPDVIVIDYADNLDPVDKREEPRHQSNTTWTLMRALSQDFHCLVVTATQIKAAGYSKIWLDRNDFSEDNRKLNQVTAMVGINVTGEEKENDVCRLNYIVRRKGRYHVKSGPSVAGCLALANPAVISCWP